MFISSKFEHNLMPHNVLQDVKLTICFVKTCEHTKISPIFARYSLSQLLIKVYLKMTRLFFFKLSTILKKLSRTFRWLKCTNIIKNIVIFCGKKLQVKMLIYQTAKMRTDNKQCT